MKGRGLSFTTQSANQRREKERKASDQSVAWVAAIMSFFQFTPHKAGIKEFHENIQTSDAIRRHPTPSAPEAVFLLGQV